ncbi:MAG: nucleotide-binding protein [Alphaproteobacteria bacterium]|nr:nucleotide-binding protein [Alphaproteobacteria bacterium]
MSKFLGSYEELKEKVSQIQIAGEWKELPNGQKQFRAKNGAILNWWETKGTLLFQGEKAKTSQFEERLTPLLETDDYFQSSQKTNSQNNKIFVVYGHDENSRTQLDAMLRRWGLDPLILDELPSKVLTIIEKLEEYTADIGFGVVLATPDDEGYPKGREDEKIFRARQNVVLELGMLLTKLGRSKVAILLKDQEKIERPSDIQGLIYIPFKSDLRKEAGPLLAKEMAEQGYSIDVKDL